MYTRRSFMSGLILLPASMLLKFKEFRWPFKPNTNLITGESIPPVQPYIPDYAVLRAQLGDYNSTFYGPHPCERCGIKIVKKALEHGGEEFVCRDGIYYGHGRSTTFSCYTDTTRAMRYSWIGANDQFYDLFVDMKTGELIDGNDIRPFLDWTPAHPEQPRWATVNYHPPGFTVYLDSEIRPIEGTQSKAVGSFAPRNPTVNESIRGKMMQVNRI